MVREKLAELSPCERLLVAMCEIGEALGLTVVDHRADLGRVCWVGKPTVQPPAIQRVVPDSDGGL
jgi:hypothetical protein